MTVGQAFFNMAVHKAVRIAAISPSVPSIFHLNARQIVTDLEKFCLRVPSRVSWQVSPRPRVPKIETRVEFLRLSTESADTKTNRRD
jgi:hypothetical protein